MNPSLHSRLFIREYREDRSEVKRTKTGAEQGGHWTATILDKLIGVLAKKPCDDAQGWV
jgi:hypothetical protein